MQGRALPDPAKTMPGKTEGTKKPGKLAGLQLGSERCSASDLQIDGLRALSATIRLRVEAHFLVFGKSGQARCLYGRYVDEDIGAAIIWLDETEALVGIEEFYSASLGHAAGPFLSVRVQRRTA
jgi:hypothetical protein